MMTPGKETTGFSILHLLKMSSSGEQLENFEEETLRILETDWQLPLEGLSLLRITLDSWLVILPTLLHVILGCLPLHTISCSWSVNISWQQQLLLQDTFILVIIITITIIM